MKQFKGTPGPWVWDGEGLGNSTMLVFGEDYPLEMTSGANKKLIAAAPELLEALTQLRGYVEDCYWSDGDGNLIESNHPMILAIRAINKALGE